MKPNILSYIVLLLLLCGCKGRNGRNDNGEVKSILMLDELIGYQFDTTLLCMGSLTSLGSAEKLVFDHSHSHFLILYFSEAMCASCVQDAIKFVKDELKFLSPSQIKLVTRYTNIRAPAIILKLNDFQLPFCNVGDSPIQCNHIELDKPVFLVLNHNGKIINLFQLRDEMEYRMRASIQILTH